MFCFCFLSMVLEEAHLLGDILATLEIVVAIWENLRLNNWHQAILLKKNTNKKKINITCVCSDALNLKNLYITYKASLCSGHIPVGRCWRIWLVHWRFQQ